MLRRGDAEQLPLSSFMFYNFIRSFSIPVVPVNQLDETIISVGVESFSPSM